MTRFAMALALLPVSFAGLAGADEKALKDLEGMYKLTYAERDGKAAEKGTIETIVITIKGDEFIMSFSPDDKKISKIKVMPDTKLSNIELTPTDGDLKGKMCPGI